MTATITAPPDGALGRLPAPGPPARGDNLLRSPLMVLGLALLGLLVLVAVFAPLLSPHDPRAITGRVLEPPSARHWLGTDNPGRDLFSQLLLGARTSLIAAVVGASLALVGALLIGVLPALIGGAADRLANRTVVFLLALPGPILLILIASLAGKSDAVIILVIGFAGAVQNARILRSQALVIRQSGFIMAARGMGGGPLYVLRRHVVPGLGPLIAVSFVNWASTAILLQAALAFLGLSDPSGVSWGLMLNRALVNTNVYFSTTWTSSVLPPGIAITLAALAFLFVGVALEPAFNPRWRRSS